MSTNGTLTDTSANISPQTCQNEFRSQTPLPPGNMPPANFLSLPAELRQTIYHLAIPTRHLSATDTLDPEHCPEPQTILSLFLTSRQIYSESAPIFYRKAILCFSVPHIVVHMSLHAWARGHSPPPPLSTSMMRHLTLSFLPDRFKLQLTTAQVFTNEFSPHARPAAYEALLAWLARYTGVRDVTISKSLMWRACKRRAIRGEEMTALEDFSAATYDQRSGHETTGMDTETGASSLAPRRTMRIYSRNDREFWEGRAMGDGRGTIVAEQAPSLRMFICVRDSVSTSLICDPRGAQRPAHGQELTDGERRHGVVAAEMMDSLWVEEEGRRTRELARRRGREKEKEGEDGGRWLFQVVFIV